MSFEFREGDRVGITGHNGSGKSTLLRVLAGVYEPVSGKLTVQGRIASMLSIALGMDGEATGYENIFICGAVLGERPKHMSRVVDEIVEFCELGDYLEMPVRTYSTGMYMRLAFAISTSIPADIILMDEWLSVGDAAFAEKAQARLNKMLEQAKILVLASHSPDLVKQTCNKVIVLDHGSIVSETACGVEP